MKNIAAIALALAIATPATAATDVWTAGMQMDEGGEVMVAWIDGTGAEGDDFPPAIRIMCFDGISLRYDSGALPDDMYPRPGDEPELLFRTDKGEAMRHSVYEDMDGALAVYVPKDDALIGLLRAGATVEVIAPQLEGFPSRSFTLKGSSAALDILYRAC